MEYNEYLKSEHWKNLRAKKLSKKKQRCGICSSVSNLDVHHLNYKDLYTVNTSDLSILCRRCHFLAHRLHKAGKIKFTSTNHLSRFALLKAAVKKELKISNVNMFK